jgi:hypothetical protein
MYKDKKIRAECGYADKVCSQPESMSSRKRKAIEREETSDSSTSNVKKRQKTEGFLLHAVFLGEPAHGFSIATTPNNAVYGCMEKVKEINSNRLSQVDVPSLILWKVTLYLSCYAELTPLFIS